MESILTSIKKLLGIAEEYTPFDMDIIMHINSVLFTLWQLGIGKKGFSIQDDAATWNDFLGERDDLEAVKTYTYLKVKLVFDPPSHSAHLAALEKQAQEYEWRLNVQVESETTTD